MQKPKSVSTVSAIVIAFSLFSMMASGIFLIFFAVAQEVFYNKPDSVTNSNLSGIDQLILRNIFGYSWIILGLAILLLIGGIAFNNRRAWSKMILQGTAVLAIICTAIPFGSMVFLSDSSTLAFLAITLWIIFAIPFASLVIYLNRHFVKEWLSFVPPPMFEEATEENENKIADRKNNEEVI